VQVAVRYREKCMKDDSSLLRAAKRLDKDGLTTIFDLYAPAIYKYVLRLCHDPIDSDHIVDDVFSLLLEQFAAGKGPTTNLRSYLYQKAYHLVVDRARHNHRSDDFEAVTEVPSKLVTLSSHAQVEERALIVTLVSALHSDLNELQRHVIILRFLEGFSLKETAAIIGKPANHVKVAQNLGISKLRKSLHLQLESDQPDLSSYTKASFSE
jgi:RNA polymerase sigma-70 factor (ECF subfamily)